MSMNVIFAALRTEETFRRACLHWPWKSGGNGPSGGWPTCPEPRWERRRSHREGSTARQQTLKVSQQLLIGQVLAEVGHALIVAAPATSWRCSGFSKRCRVSRCNWSFRFFPAVFFMAFLSFRREQRLAQPGRILYICISDSSPEVYAFASPNFAQSLG